MPITRGATPAVAKPRMRAIGVEAVRFGRLGRGDDQRRRAVVDARSVARRHAAVRAHDAGELRQRLERRVGAGMLVLLDARHVALAVLDLDRDDFLVERPVRLRRGGALLRAQRERVLVGARDLIFVGDVLGRLRHRIDAVELFHHRIDEAPADGRVEDLGRALKRASAALPITNGARVIDSTPPATASSISPALIARAAAATASMPEAHRRLTVAPGIESGRPASRSAMRATLRLSSPAWLAQPRKTSSTFSRKAGMAAHELADRRRGEIVGAHGARAPRRNGRSGCGHSRR